jgi:hypothetical protein
MSRQPARAPLREGLALTIEIFGEHPAIAA